MLDFNEGVHARLAENQSGDARAQLTAIYEDGEQGGTLRWFCDGCEVATASNWHRLTALLAESGWLPRRNAVRGPRSDSQPRSAPDSDLAAGA